MTRRLCSLVLLAFLSLAFAPAPFPKRDGRAKDSLAVKNLLGTWRATALYFPPNQNKLNAAAQGVGEVTISPTQWIFEKGKGNTTYDLRIHHDKNPVEIDFMHVGKPEPYGRGLIRREGNTLRIIYAWGNRPAGFENQQSGVVIMLVRESAAY